MPSRSRASWVAANWKFFIACWPAAPATRRGPLAGRVAAAQASQRRHLGWGEPTRADVEGQHALGQAALPRSQGDGEADHGEEQRDHEAEVAVQHDQGLGQGDRERRQQVERAVQDHRQQQAGDRGQPAHPAVAGTGRDAQADAGHRGEQRVRETGEQNAHDEDQEEVLQAGRRAVFLDARRVAVLAQVEDVFHHREADRRQAAVDDAVGDAGPLGAPAPDQQDRAEGLHRLLDERGHQDRYQGVRQTQAVEEHRRAGVDQQGHAGGDRGAPGEAEGQVADRLGLVAVQPQEAGHQQRNRQHGGGQADHQAGDADVEAQEEQHGDGGQGQEADHDGHRQPATHAGAALVGQHGAGVRRHQRLRLRLTKGASRRRLTKGARGRRLTKGAGRRRLFIRRGLLESAGREGTNRGVPGRIERRGRVGGGRRSARVGRSRQRLGGHAARRRFRGGRDGLRRRGALVGRSARRNVGHAVSVVTRRRVGGPASARDDRYRP